MREWAQKIVAGDVRALARAATAIENRTPESEELLRELDPHTGHATVIGITGPPGAGKSTLVDALAKALRRNNHSVGIIAVDPTSRISGGAILGDRVRMQDHHADPGIFIRSMATRGAMGGLARTTADMVRLLSAAGREFVVIETVGVGQDEVEIAGLAQITVVVLVPGMGDEIQAIKAGIMEIADIFVINKADHPGADRVEREIHANSHAPIVRTIATEDTGIEELLAQIRQVPRKEHGPRAGRATIDHVGIAVESIDAALDLFERQLGMTLQGRETVEQARMAALEAGGPRIQLLEAAAATSPGLHHLALKVPDLRAAVERLRFEGARTLDERCPGAAGHESVFIHPASTGGVLLELIQE